MSEPPYFVGESAGAQPVKESRGLLDVSVLVVDDVGDNLDLIEEMLGEDVWSVQRAQSGEEAVRLAVESLPDVILLDMMMPRMNGLAVLRAIRSHKALESTPVILQTAHADKETIITARRLGCSSFLCKPLTRSRLLAELSKCLESRPCRRGDNEPLDDSTPTQKMRELTLTLTHAKAMLETDRLADDTSNPAPVNCFRKLIPKDTEMGQRLIRLANSLSYGGRYPTRTVAEAVVRIGIRKTSSLIRKASSTTAQEISKHNVLKAPDLLENLTILFPDRTSTPDGTLSLLKELNAAAQSTHSASAIAVRPGQEETATGSEQECNETGTIG